MAVHIRLARFGTNKAPFYRIVVADQRSPRGGRFIERIGTFDPLRSELRVEGARVKHWLDRGAQPSATVKVLFKNAKVLGEPAAATPPAAPAAPAAKKKA
jgi:small subunit ribosomal protein S16